MAKQLNVNLAFKADIGEAKTQLQELQRSLNTLITSTTKTTNGLGITQDIVEATTKVAKLQAMLEQSKSTTGGLDLGKFNQSLKQSGMQISDYAKTLSSLGPVGDQAFAQLAKSVIHAEVPLKRTSTLLNEFKTTLSNTVRWQISSSILHGFMGSVQQAFGYAQDLNESLNNIRIVTGQNTEQMAKFAEQANKAAKALSTTTTAYTDAALIFYQQGLKGTDVTDRADVVVKMANVSKQSAKDVSDQMTSIWNNFYDGSQSLESYADKITALGAATASSSEEISTGLEKFAAVAETVGLSYEYATAALATVTATTRQSADVVGTAFKTLFARLNDLKFGETLDDGTTLGQYTENLAKIGVNIKDASGQLKDMDVILEETAAKWQNLDKDQQVALAKGVAGIRQYTQFIALMDNWDFMKDNLQVVEQSGGTLQKQADIYAESWEAAKDRVTAAAEEIYNQLLNDEFFIDLNNGFAGFLNILSNTIDGLGGLPGVLLVVSSLMMKLFGKDMATAIDNWGYNIKLRSKEGIQDILNMRQKAVESLKTMYANNIDTGPTNSVSARAFEADANLADQLLVKEQELLTKGTALTAEKKQEAQYMIQITEQFGQQAIQSAKLLEKTEQQGNELEQQLKNQIRKHNANVPEGGSKIDYQKDIAPQIQSAKQLQVQYSALESAFNKLKVAQSKGLSTETIIQELERMSTEAENAGLDITSFKTALANLNSGMDVKTALDSIETDMYQIGDAAFEASDEIRTALSGAGMSGQQVDAILDQLYNSWVQQGIMTAEVAEKLKNVSIQAETAGKKIAEMQGPPPTVGQKIVAVGNLLSNVAMSVSAVKGLFDTWNNEDMSFGDKLISSFTTLGMLIPLVKSAFDANNRAMLGSVAPSIAAAMGFSKTGVAAGVAAGGVTALWATLWPIALAAAAVALVITGLVVAFNAISDAYNKDALAAERAEESARNLADAYNTAKTEYEEMISAMEAYQSARDGLDSLTEGTEAYVSALKEANRQALELINQYGLIEGQDYEWKGDELVIKDSSMSRIRSDKEDEVDKAYAASQMANIEAMRTKAVADQTALRREIRDDNGLGTGDQIWKGISNILVGAALGPVGLMAGVGATIATGIEGEAYDEAINKAIEESKTNANLFDTKNSMANTLNIDDQDLIDALWANRDSIQELSADMNAAAQAEKLAAQNAANEIMSESGYENTKAGKMAMEAGGEVYQQIYGDAYDKYLADAEDRGPLNTGTKESEAAFEQYAKEARLDQLKNFEVTNYKGDGTVEYKYIDEEGQEQIKIATAEEIAATLAAADAANSLEGALSALRTEIANLNLSNNEADHALAEFISKGNLEGATKEEYDTIASEIGDITNDADIEAYLDKKFGDGKDGQISDETAKKYGYENADAMVQAMKASLEIKWEVPNGVADEIADKFTLGAAAKIQSAYEKMGEQGGQAFVETVNTIASGADWDALSLEDQTAMLDEIANIDWTSWDAGEQAIAIAEKYGVAIDGTTKAWQDNVNAMRDAANALPDLEAMRQEYEKIKEITSDIDLGSILKEEDYKTLVNYNSELERYFAILSDGSAQFIGDKLDFQQEIEAQHTQELLEAMQVYKDRNAEIEAQIKAGENAVGGADKLDQYRDSENDVGNDGKNQYSRGNVNKQLDFLESQGYDSEQLATWREDLADRGTTVSVLEDIAKAVDSTADSFNNLGAEAAENEALIRGMMNEVALSAENASERAELLESGLIDADAYGYAAMAAHNKEKWEGMDPDEVEDYADSLMNAANASGLLSDELKDNEEAAEDVALYTKKMNNGIEALSEGFEDWSDVLTKSDKASEEYSEAMNGMKSAMSDILGVSEDFLSDDFIIQNMEDIKKAAEGDAEAIDRLAIAAGKDILINVGIQDENVLNEVLALHDALAAQIPDIKVGATIDSGDFLAQAAQIVESAGMTVEQANAYFRSMGFEPNFETKEVPVESKQPVVETLTEDAGTENVTYEQVNSDGSTSTVSVPMVKTRQTSRTVGYTTSKEMIEVPALTTDGGTPNFTLTRTNSGAMNNLSSSNSGGKSPNGSGGGSTSKAKDSRKKKSDVTERYKEINDSLEKTNHLMKKNSTLAEGMWGKDKINKMKQNINLMKQENDLLEDKLKLANKYLAEDRAELIATGIGFTFEDGYITNYTKVMDSLFAEYDAKWNSFSGGNEDAELSEEQKEVLDKMWQHIETVKTAYEKYEGTLDEVQDLQQEQIEKSLAIQQKNFDLLKENLEIKLSINEDDLSIIEYYLNKISDDFYSMAEAAALMIGNTSKKLGQGSGQLGNYLSNLSLQKDYYNTLRNNFATIDPSTGKTYINQQQYIEGLRDSRDALIDNLNSLNELDKTMSNYYSDTLAAAGEELSKYTTRMEHQTSVLKHYSSVMEIMGKQQDYESIGVILEAQVQAIEDQMEIAKANYEMLAEQEKLRRKAYDKAIARGASKEELEVYKNNWEAAADAVNEAQEEMLLKTEAWAEAMKSVVKNKLSSLAQSLENALTGGFGSFDALSTQLKHASSLQENYLTTTNKIYETNKMMRTAQQEIDKSTDSIAKKKLKNFINETEQLQNQTKLSQYELKIQQAKYDLLLAQIALEEAQGAKSTVRLQRDTEGNFGYVYTADQNKIAEAEQKFADAQNSLYNIGLEGANNYTEKYQQTLSEFYNTMTELQTQYLNGEFENEQEYQDKMVEAKDFYYKKLQEYSELYTIAIGTDARVIQDAWSTEFQSMVNGTEKWKTAVDGYVDEVNLAFEDWEKVVNRLAEQTVGKDLTTLKIKTSDITDASMDLKTKLIGTDGKSGLVKGFGDVSNAVANTTGKYAAMREEINKLITKYEELLKTINKDIQNENNGKSIGGTKTGNNTASTNASNNTSNSANSTPKTISTGANVKASPSAQIYDYAGDTSGEYQYYAYDPNYVVISQNGEWIQVRHHTRSSGITGWFKKSDLTAFDTGGYTGDWGGSYGKLAMLHQKELVLKEGDTENFLASMELLDNIVKTIDLYSANAQWGGMLSSPTFGNYNGQEPIEQNVYIEANFPEATDRNEIIEAINTLSNQASQFVNRK